VRIEPALSTNDGDVLCAWARAGHGIIVRSEWSVADDIKAGRLTTILSDFELAEADVVVLLGPRAQRSTRTRLFLDHLRAALTPVPWR
jgi:DNA-binding transcriptional LysR family regulator